MKTASVVSSVVAALGLSAAAHATPVTYDYTSGSIDITGITVDGTSVLPTGSEPAIVLATTSTATLDTTADTLSFAVSQAAATTITLCCSFTSGSNTFSFASADAILSSLTADSIGSLTLTSTGSDTWSFSSGSSNGVTLSGTSSITGATENGTALGTLGPKSWSGGKPISGNIAVTANQQTLQMDGVPLGSYTVDGMPVTVTGNIIFQGNAVPIPGTAWLLASALGLLGVLLARAQLRPTRSRESWA
jgi:hypothetical protein